MSALEFENKSIIGNRGRCEVGEQIGNGSEGVVYQIRSNEEYVVKIFNPEVREDKVEKLRVMVKEKHRPVDLTFKDRGTRTLIWPEDIVKNPSTDEFLGFRMKNIGGAESAISYALTDLSWDRSTEEERMRVARNFAALVETVHKQGHAIGDFNDDNVLIKDGYVILIDCDAFHIQADGEVYVGETWYPENSPPEERPMDLGAVQKADRFGLGIYIFRFLLEGNHPFVAKGPRAESGTLREMLLHNPFPYTIGRSDVQPHDHLKRKYEKLPSGVRSAFERCFDSGKLEPEKRPKAEHWRRTIERASDLKVEYRRYDEDPKESTIWEGWDIQRTDRTDVNSRGKDDLWELWNV